MSYGVLGTSCKTQSVVCTSNHKFLALRDPVYRKQYTYMMQYPGDSITSNLSNIFAEPDHKHPEVIKSYYGKIYGHDAESDHVHNSHIDHVGYSRAHEHIHDHAPNHGHGVIPGYEHLGQMKSTCKTCT